MNTELTERFPPPRRILPIALVAACLTALAAGPIGAQDSGIGDPQGRQAEGEPQGRERTEAVGRAMPGSRTEPEKAMMYDDASAMVAEGAAAPEGSMEQALGEGRAQLPVEETLGPAFDAGADQVPREELELSALTGAPAEPFLVLVLRITRDGESEILSATEMVGEPPASDQALSDFVFEVTDGSELLGVQALPGDPFEGHSFGGGPGSPEGHHFIELDEATVTVRVPKRSLDSVLDRVSLNLYRLEAGPEVEAFSPSVMRSLQRDQRLQLVTSISGAEIGDFVREKGTRLDVQQ